MAYKPPYMVFIPPYMGPRPPHIMASRPLLRTRNIIKHVSERFNAQICQNRATLIFRVPLVEAKMKLLQPSHAIMVVEIAAESIPDVYFITHSR